MKFLKALVAFFVYYFIILFFITIITPESILKSSFGVILFFVTLGLAIYIAIKAYKLNTLSLFKIFNHKKKNSQIQIEKEVEFIKNLSKNRSTYSSDSKFAFPKNKSSKETQTSINKEADIEIIYEKENGEISQRKIKVNKIDNKYLYGYCFLRNEDRTFRLDRIKKLIDLTTFEVITNKEGIIDYLQTMFSENEFIKEIQTNNKNYIGEGYFYGKVDLIIADVNKDFHIIYKDNYEFDAAVIRVGKSLYDDKLMLLIRNLDTDEFASLYVDKIIEMYDLTTGEVISNISEYFEKIYEKEYIKHLEKEAKRQEKEKIENFIDKHLDLLKMLIYIAKSDGTINSKEKDILIDTLKTYLPEIPEPNKIIDKVSKNHLYFNSYNSFAHNAKRIMENYPEINFLEYAEKIVSTQKSIHSDEEKILNYLSKYYNRDYQLKHELISKKQRVFYNEPCPHCNSTHTIKKGKREYKNYTAQRYECQDCGKIFSIKIEEKDDNEK
ncbi:hypothetical protein JCM11957_07140 [Caminibacter profundus]